jgi:FkbM family methyltransferase
MRRWPAHNDRSRCVNPNRTDKMRSFIKSILAPFLVPFLNRIEGRVRRSLEALGIHSAVMRTDEGVRAIEAGNRHAQSQLETLIRMHALNEVRIDSVQAALDRQESTLLELRGAREEKVVLWLAPIEARLFDVQDGLLDIRQRLQKLETRSAEVEDRSLHLMQDGLLDIRQRLQMLETRSAVVEDRSLHLLTRQTVQLSDGFTAVQTPQGWLVVPEEDDWLLIHLANGRAYHELGTLRVMTALLREGDTVIDAGAHIGLLTIPMARSVGRSGRVIAIEPMARSCEALRRSLTLNMMLQVEVRQVAIADAPGQGSMFAGANSMMTSLFSENKDRGNQATTEVEQARLDDLVKSAGPVSLVKLDVEGAELLALAGMHTILDRNSEIMVVAEYGPFYIRRAGINIDDWFAKFAELGLTSIYQIDEETGLCRKGRPTAEPVDSPSINVLFSRPGNPRLASLHTARQ